MPGKRKFSETLANDNPFAALSRVKGDLEDVVAARQLQRQKRRRVLREVSQAAEGLCVGWDLGDAGELDGHAVQDLICSVIDPELPAPGWLQLKTPEGPPNVCVLTVPGLQWPLYSQASAESCPWLARVFGQPIQTRLDGRLRSDSTLWSLWVVRSRKDCDPEPGDGPQEGVPRLQPDAGMLDRFLLTKEQRLDNGFVVAESDLVMPAGYKRLPPRPTEQQELHWVAIDCEMCVTAVGYELTRVAVVHSGTAVVYDELVKPPHPIRDYLTDITGLTPERMQPVTKTLEEVQKDLCSLLYADTILVGHSLGNDLKALRLVHDRVIDTAVMYSDPSVPAAKPALRVLAHKYLQRSIQGYATSYYRKAMPNKDSEKKQRRGHDSVEDATACLDLVLYRIQQGPGFVPHMGLSNVLHMAHAKGRAVYCAGPGEILQKFTPTAAHLATPTDDVGTVGQGVQWLKSMGPSPATLWLHCKGFESHYAKVKHIMTKDKAGPKPTEAEHELLHYLDTAVHQLMDAAPSNTLFVLWSGQGPIHQLEGNRVLDKGIDAKLRQGVLWLYAKGTSDVIPLTAAAHSSSKNRKSAKRKAHASFEVML